MWTAQTDGKKLKAQNPRITQKPAPLRFKCISLQLFSNLIVYVDFKHIFLNYEIYMQDQTNWIIEKIQKEIIEEYNI